MALVNADRVKETSTTPGTGTYDLAGAVTGFRTFVSGVGNGNTCWYCATDGTDWEIGVGTVTDATPDTLARTTIYASSNAGAAVNWGAGTRTLFCTLPAGRVGAASDSDPGLIETATAAETVTGTDTGRAVVPGRQQYHASAIKCWGQTTGAGTPALTTSSNVTSITDTATGRLTVTQANDFATADWCGTSTLACATLNPRDTSLVSKAAGSVIIEAFLYGTGLSDPGAGWDWQFTGTLA